MSNIYIKEPATNGKVILKTTLGDIDCELWSREAPKACRNFVQLCLEGYYDGSIFHRVLKGFIAQGGDPTGTGLCGDSIYGEPFRDEFHSRLRFVRRGLLAMANSEKDANGSQFFFTLGATPELQEKHTIFGKVTGNTLYNMIKFDDLQVDQNDRPLYPPKIISTEVVFNPFDDILPRVKESKKISKKEERPKVKGTKDFKLLSFGDEAEEEEELVEEIVKGFKGKGKSSHDLLDDPRLSSVPAVDPSLAAINNRRLKDDAGDALNSDEDLEEGSSKKRRKMGLRTKLFPNSNPFGEGTSKDFLDDPILEEDPMMDTKQSKLEQLRNESKELKKSLAKKKSKPEVDLMPKKHLDPMIEAIKQQTEQYKSAKVDKLSYDEKFTKMKEKFKLAEKNETSSETFIPKSLASIFSHRMACEDTEPVLAKDANLRNEADWYDINDPRHPVNKRRREAANETETPNKKSNNHSGKW